METNSDILKEIIPLDFSINEIIHKAKRLLDENPNKVLELYNPEFPSVSVEIKKEKEMETGLDKLVFSFGSSGVLTIPGKPPRK